MLIGNRINDSVQDVRYGNAKRNMKKTTRIQQKEIVESVGRSPVYACSRKSETPNRILMSFVRFTFLCYHFTCLLDRKSFVPTPLAKRNTAFMNTYRHIYERCRGDGKPSKTIYCTFCFQKTRKRKRKRRSSSSKSEQEEVMHKHTLVDKTFDRLFDWVVCMRCAPYPHTIRYFFFLCFCFCWRSRFIASYLSSIERHIHLYALASSYYIVSEYRMRTTLSYTQVDSALLFHIQHKHVVPWIGAIRSE